MKIVLLCASQHNQVALANKIAERFELIGIVIEKRNNPKNSVASVSVLLEKILNKTFFISIRNAWFGMLDHYQQKFPFFPQINTKQVDNINSPETIEFIKNCKPDLLMVSGTSLVRKKILELPIPFGIINLHTGLSPYIKGGPNCTNWCIAENKMQFIGNTVMWIDAGIDSGDLLTTELTPLTGKESLLHLHIKVMEHAHEIYINAVQKIETDLNNCPRVKQSVIGTGITYFNKQWNWRAKISLLKNMKRLPSVISSEKFKQDRDAVITVSL